MLAYFAFHISYAQTRALKLLLLLLLLLLRFFLSFSLRAIVVADCGKKSSLIDEARTNHNHNYGKRVIVKGKSTESRREETLNELIELVARSRPGRSPQLDRSLTGSLVARCFDRLLAYLPGLVRS